MSILIDLFKFLRKSRKFWLVPIVLLLVTVGGLLLFAQGSVLAPFIYTLF
ncbi:MAG: hypothetical protein JWN34_5756 [Bryobacterales bacterium]|jgi:hypothetical protein|nr:hypothetical protein [Bryobacterales bacterium]